MSPHESISDEAARDPPADEIDEDLYCLFCGYNLRGLSGNPARCPECGGLNDRSVVLLPAAQIRAELLNMETAPALCVGVFLTAFLVAFPLLTLGELSSAVAIFFFAGLIWLLPYFRMRFVFENKPGWRAVLRDFHLATACWVAGVFLPLVLLLARGTGLPPVARAMMCLPVVGLFPLGMWIYRRGQTRIDILQRHKAVAIVQRYFQRLNSTRPGGQFQ